MDTGLLKRMSGEELLLVRILYGESVADLIDTELDRRARTGPERRPARSVRSSLSTRRRRHAASVASAA